MTVLGAVVFGGFLVLGVLWLLITAPSSDAYQARDHFPGAIGAPDVVPESWALIHSSGS